MAVFENEPLASQDLPRLEDDNYVPVHPSFLRVSLIGMAGAAAITAIAGVIVAIVVPRNSWVPLAITVGVLALIGLSAALRIVEVRNIAYQVRTHDVSYRSGVLIKTVATIPFVRVQHARIRQGPVQRRFGLATLEINSAGPDLRIHGLGTDSAERLKVLIVERAGDSIEDE